MKICEKCGHRNWKPEKKCSQCGKALEGSALNKPMVGHDEMVHATDNRGVSVGKTTRIYPLKNPDEI